MEPLFDHKEADFSCSIGTRGFETIGKVYGNEDPIYLSNVEISSYPHDEKTRRDSAAGHSTGLERRLDSLHLARSRGPVDLYATARGLRSIPYVIFAGKRLNRRKSYTWPMNNKMKANRWTTDTSMTESCALHLSYIIPLHPTSTQLLKRVPPAKAGPSAQRLLSYNADVR